MLHLSRLTTVWPRLSRAPSGLLLAGLLALGALLPGLSAAEDIRFGQGLLWRVQQDGGPASYVLGTFHTAEPQLRNLPPAVRQALEDSEDVAFEFVATPEVRQTMAQALQLPAGQRLEELLGSELFGRCVAAVAPLGVPAEHLQRLKPWALSVFLLFPPQELVRQANGEPPFDFWLQAEATRLGKRLHSLETVEQQIALFDDMSLVDQRAMVTDMIADYARVEQRFNDMLRAYTDGDLSFIMDLANDYSAVSDPEAADRLKRRLLDDRNKGMVRSMLPLLRGTGAFVAIGAAHLPGDGGVLDLLEAQGYRVTRAY